MSEWQDTAEWWGKCLCAVADVLWARIVLYATGAYRRFDRRQRRGDGRAKPTERTEWERPTI